MSRRGGSRRPISPAGGRWRGWSGWRGWSCGAAIALALGCGAGCRGADQAALSDGGAIVDAGDPCAAPRLPARLRRLSRFEYDNAVRDLLGIAGHWGATLPPDDAVDGFDDNAAALRVGPLLEARLLAAAEGAADEAAPSLPSLAGCADESEACAAQLVSRLGRRAFRRPLTAEEQQRYLGLHRQVAAADGSFVEGQKAVVEALLHSPHFLYRPEIGRAQPGSTLAQLDDHEIAAQLSFLFWASIPDDALLDAADAGALHTPEQIEAAARRLLGAAQSTARLAHFAEEWLGVGAVLTAPKLGDAAAALTPALRQAMLDEARADFERAVRAGARAPELLTSGETVTSDELARFYGIEGDPLQRLDDGTARWPVGAAHRGGLLATGAVLAGYAHPDSASPVARGKLVRERLLCLPLPAPPVGVIITLPPVVPGQSNRERFSQHMADPYCAGCHKLMDPVGFGFERYDAAGRYQPADGSGPIDEHGELFDTPHSDGKFAGIAELSRKLAQSPDFAACVAAPWTRSAFGVGGTEDITCLTSAAQSEFQKSDLRLDELLISFARSPQFRMREVRP